MIKNFLLTTFCFFSLCLFSQERDIKGSVADKESGMPLLGVNVIIEGTTQGTTTDFDGNFILASVQKDATLVFSYLGFKTLKIKWHGQTQFDVQLESDTESLDDVVVIGYGSSSKRKITGSVSTVNSESIQDLEPINAATALQGLPQE